MCEILGGAFTGNGAAGPLPRPFSNGMLSIYMTVDFFDVDDFFGAEMRAYLDFVRAARPAAAGGEVRLPGETAQRYAATRPAAGVTLPETGGASSGESVCRYV